jgi:hypothetical protein
MEDASPPLLGLQKWYSAVERRELQRASLSLQEAPAGLHREYASHSSLTAALSRGPVKSKTSRASCREGWSSEAAETDTQGGYRAMAAKIGFELEPPL